MIYLDLNSARSGKWKSLGQTVKIVSLSNISIISSDLIFAIQTQSKKMPITIIDDSQLPCKKADTDIKNGATAYHDFARIVFPILVNHAKSGFLPYSELTTECGLDPYFDLTWPLAIIGRAIEKYNKDSKGYIPRITFMVVKKSDFSSPLVGTKCFVVEGEKVITEGILKKEINKIINYDKWDEVLKEFGLEIIY